MFSVVPEQRQLRVEDFHVPNDEDEAPDHRELTIEAVFAFPELLEDPSRPAPAPDGTGTDAETTTGEVSDDVGAAEVDAAGSSASGASDAADPAGTVPEFFTQMSADDNGELKLRIVLQASWSAEGPVTGTIEDSRRVVHTFAEDYGAEWIELKASDRNRIQMVYVPATRDGARQVPTVDFVMLNRLAELVIRTSTQLQRALTATYPYVFVDEFQDTTYAQYSFLRSVFAQAKTIVTAVGDRKQRIMGWAGALGDAFAEFERDFSAAPFVLTSNFRSTQQLVDLQHLFAQRLDPQSQLQLSQSSSQVSGSPVQIWSFSTSALEADSIAAWIAADIEQSGRPPSEYALIARQKVADLEPELTRAFGQQGLKVRNDDALVGLVRLQDLLKEEFVRLLIGLVRLAGSRGGQPQAWRDVTATLTRLAPSGREREVGSNMDDALSDFVAELRAWFKQVPFSEPISADGKADLTDVAAEALTDTLTAFVRFDDIASKRILADRPEDLTVTLEAFKIRLTEVLGQVESWDKVAEAFTDEEAVPLLTIHRSKGLEYHTVFFIGLDRDQWWAHTRNTVESTMTFFVGVSRAAERLFFTQCDERGAPEPIADIYEVLERAGVSLLRIG